MIQNVCVVGGTHGNEYTGVYLLKEFLLKSKFNYSFELSGILANPKAIEINRRYVDEDLNRAFSNESLNNLDRETNEAQVVKNIYNQIGPESDDPSDFIIDLHTTTSYMGPTINISKSDPVTLNCINHIVKKFPEVTIFEDDVLDDDSYMVNKAAPMGFLVEVGPVANGMLSASVFENTKMLVMEALEYLDGLNKGIYQLEELPLKMERYLIRKKIQLPTNDKGELAGMVHPNLEGRDFNVVKAGDPLFLLFNGDVIVHEGEDFYPIFINEAAYFENQVAMVACDYLKE